VVLGTAFYGKPRDRREAARMLGELQGRTHQVVTGLCLIHLREHRERLCADVTDVRFRPLGEAEIDRYLERMDPLDKAGAYAIQEFGELLVEEIGGSYTNVVGLPVERLESELRAWLRPTPAVPEPEH
jgi:septum formation protein